MICCKVNKLDCFLSHVQGLLHGVFPVISVNLSVCFVHTTVTNGYINMCKFDILPHTQQMYKFLRCLCMVLRH